MATQGLQFADIKTSQETAPPVFDQQGMPKTPVIPADMSTGATKLNIPQPDYNTGAYDSAVAGVSTGVKSLDQYIKEMTPTPTDADKSQQAILDRIASLTGESVGRAGYQAEQENLQGLPNLQTQLRQLQGEITQGEAEYKTLDTKATVEAAKLDNTGLTRSEYGGEAGKIARNLALDKALKAADLTAKYAKASALSGNISNALELASRATDIKYKPIEDELKIRQAQLAALEPTLNREEKVRAEALRRQYEDEMMVIEDRKEKEKQVNQIMVEAAKFGADQETLNRIQRSGSLGDAIKNSGDFLGAEFKQKLEQQRFENELNLQQLSISRANLAVSRGNLALSQRRQAFEEAQSAGLMSADGQVSPELVAYAQQYASTGKVPSGMPKGTFGIVSEAAKSLPKPDGTLVDINTGVKPDGMSAGQADGVTALYDLTKKLKDAEDLFKTFKTGAIAGAWNKAFPTAENTRYNTLRSEIVDLLSRARSGAALTETEIMEYQKKIPARTVNSLFTGPKGTDLLKGLRSSIEGKLETSLKANGAAIYGYSKVKINDKDYTVGSIIDNGQMKARVNPDGTLTLVQ